MKILNQKKQVITAVGFHGGWLRVLQAGLNGEGPVSLLGVKARQMIGFNEEEVANALREMLRELPEPPQEVVGLLSTGQMVTRYLALPSEDPEELRRMALYQLEGMLPFPMQECVYSVKPLGPAGEATRVLVAVARRPDVERLVRCCQRAGLNLTAIAASSETVGRWHQLCRSADAPSPGGWLIVERGLDGAEVAILAQGSLVYMRQVPRGSGGVEDLAVQFRQTMQAYEREQVGPPVRQVTLSGLLEDLGPGFLERLEASLGLPVERVDLPQGLSSMEVSFTELLGAVCAPRLLGLDLLPMEVRERQTKQALLRELRRTALWALLGAALVVGWVGVKAAGRGWQLRQAMEQQRLLEPRVAQVKRAARAIREAALARRRHASLMEWMNGAVRRLSAGMTLQFLGLDGDRVFTLRGLAPDLGRVTAYASGLRGDPLWDTVTLRFARGRSKPEPAVEFELLLKPRVELEAGASAPTPSGEIQEQLARMQGWLSVEEKVMARLQQDLGASAQGSGEDLAWTALQGIERMVVAQGLTVVELRPTASHLDAQVEGRLEQVGRLLEQLPDAIPGVRLESFQLTPKEGERVQAILRIAPPGRNR